MKEQRSGQRRNWRSGERERRRQHCSYHGEPDLLSASSCCLLPSVLLGECHQELFGFGCCPQNQSKLVIYYRQKIILWTLIFFALFWWEIIYISTQILINILYKKYIILTTWIWTFPNYKLLTNATFEGKSIFDNCLYNDNCDQCNTHYR